MNLKNSLRNLQSTRTTPEIRTPGRYANRAGARLGVLLWLVPTACSAATPRNTPSVEPPATTYTASEPTSSPVALNETTPEHAATSETVTPNVNAPALDDRTPASPAPRESRPSGEPPSSSQATAATATPIRAKLQQLLTVPVDRLVAGKRRGAGIKQDENKTTLHVFSLEPGSNGGHPALPLTAPVPDSVWLEHSYRWLFMGRDDWPRVTTSPGQQCVGYPGHGHYFRFRPGKGWEEPRDELGGLWDPGRHTGLYGLLGHEDPEVLCAPGFFCYEKRLSGWRKRPVPGDHTWTMQLLSDGHVWAWNASLPSPLCRLSETWECLMPYPTEPREDVLVSLVYVGAKYLGVTEKGAWLFDPTVSFFDGEWTPLSGFADVVDVHALDATRALVLTRQGLLVWDGSFHPISLSGSTFMGGGGLHPIPGQGAGLAKSFIVGGKHGVTRIDIEGL